MHRSVPAFAAVLAIGSVLGSAAPAAADGPLAPGDSRTIRLTVPETWTAALQVDVTAGTLTQVENACLDPEAEAGDDCSSTVGELADQLTGTVTLGVLGSAGCEPGAQSANLDLFGTRTTRLTAEAPGVECLFLELTFPDDEGDNLAQSDSLTLGLDLVARDFLDSGEPGGDAGTDGQIGADEGSGTPDGEGAGTVDPDTETAQSETGRDGNGRTTTDPGEADQAAGSDTGAVAAAAAGPAGTVVGEAPAGPVLDRVEARVSVGDDGVAVQTQAAETSVRGLVLAWGSLLLGAIALGWAAFVVVMRRRRKKVVA